MSVLISKPVKSNFSAVNDDVSFAPHTHDYFEVVITIENNFIHTVNGESFRPRNGDVIILRPTDVHSARPIDDSLPRKVRDVYVASGLFSSCCESLSPGLFEKLTADVRDHPPGFHLSSSSLSSLEQRLSYPFIVGGAEILTEYEGQIDMIERAIVTELLGYYLYENFFDDKQLPECIIRLMNALQGQRFSRLRIEEMASELGYSHTYLCREFKSCFGKTLERYLIDERVGKAVSLLEQTDMSVQKISISLGWKKAGNFIAAFKRVYGMTPTQYRRNH